MLAETHTQNPLPATSPAGPLARGLASMWRRRSEEVCAGEPLPLVARVLAARGLADPNAAAEFLSPALKQLHDPSLIPDLDRACERIVGAIKASEPIVIYGDYDVDGITATAILFHTLRAVAGTPPGRRWPRPPCRTPPPADLDAIREIAAGGEGDRARSTV